MTETAHPPEERPARDPSVPPWWQIVLGIEAVLLLIAFVVPLTPSKTGSDVSIADLFFEAPTYTQKVLVGWLFLNGVVGLFALAFVLVQRRNARTRARSGPSGDGA